MFFVTRKRAVRLASQWDRLVRRSLKLHAQASDAEKRVSAAIELLHVERDSITLAKAAAARIIDATHK